MKKKLSAALCVVFLVISSVTVFGYHETLTVIVNGRQLSPQILHQLEQTYGSVAPSGRYWYDRVSGLWGQEGGPAAGQIAPSLALGGPLQANASGGATPVFINGRALHPTEVAGLRQCYGTVIPGRYWMNAQGIGGVEGGAAIFNVATECGTAGGGASSSRSDITDTGVMSDGNGFVGIIGKGWSVMSGN